MTTVSSAKLNPQKVESLFEACLFEEEAVAKKAPLIDGITMKVVFDPNRIKKHSEEIFSLLKELPPEFMQSGGGGMSFLNACMDKHGNQWTGVHRTMEMLFLLGFGIGKAEFTLSRKMWVMLPGGMPYLMVKDK